MAPFVQQIAATGNLSFRLFTGFGTEAVGACTVDLAVFNQRIGNMMRLRWVAEKDAQKEISIFQPATFFVPAANFQRNGMTMHHTVGVNAT